MVKEYTVSIGGDQLQVEARDNREAAYKAARLFRKEYNLNCSLSDIVYYARTHLISAYTTQEVLSFLGKE